MATEAARECYDTPSIPESEALLLIKTTTRIAAPANLVFRTLRNTDTWKDWCWFVPRVDITEQPPEPDAATAVEIQELVRNTSIAGSFNSELTDGLIGGGTIKRKETPPPDLPALKLRQKSDASAFSAVRSSSEASQHARPSTEQPASPARNNSTTPSQGGLSAAQKYAAAQASRRSSAAPGEDLPPVTSNTLQVDPFQSISSADSTRPGSRSKKDKLDPSVQIALAKTRERNAVAALAIYGEPSVRIQLNTKMSFFLRMNPQKPNDYKHLFVHVTEVSRPDDPLVEGSNLTALTRTKTHTLARNNLYRIVWSMDNSKSGLGTMKNGSSYPKFLLQAERVHEIRPILLGDGTEECEYRQWECQKGQLAKVVKKKYGTYLQTMSDRWNAGLGEFCEAMGGKVDRRDFINKMSQPIAEENENGNGFNEVTVFSTAAFK